MTTLHSFCAKRIAVAAPTPVADPVIIATFFTGPLQSSSRVVMANLTDDNRQGFSFGIFTLSGKITAFLGPILASALTFLISQRVGFGFSIVLLSLGLFLMIGVSYSNVKSKT